MQPSSPVTQRRTQLMQSTVVVTLLAAICTFLWGSAYSCIKIGYSLFHIGSDQTWTQVQFAGIRFFLAGVLTVLIGSAAGRSLLIPKKSSIPKILLISAFQTVMQYIFFYCGLAHTSGMKSSILGSSGTFFTILISCLIFRYERLTARKLLGCAFGFAGVILVNLPSGGLDLGMTFTGEGFILLSALGYAMSSVLLKKYSADESPVLLSGYQFIFGGLVMILLGGALGGRVETVTPGGVAILLYLAMVSAVAYSLWGILLKYNPVSKIAMFSFMTPAFGVLLSAWWLGESGQMSPLRTAAALVLVCIGICIVNGVTIKKQSKMPAPNL